MVKTAAVNRSAIIPVGAASALVPAGGSGAAVGDVLTLVGGTLTPANAATGTPAGTGATFTVSAVSSGAVTAVALKSAGSYTALPTSPAATTSSGAGTGATLNPSYVSQAITLAPANPLRRGFRVQPQGNSAYVNLLATATADQNSLLIPANAIEESSTVFVGSGAISVVSSSTFPVPVYAREF